jgi:hypothetical protein
MYLSKKYKESSKILEVKSKSTIVCRGGGLLQWIDIQKTQNSTRIYMRAPNIQYFMAWTTFQTPLKI